MKPLTVLSAAGQVAEHLRGELLRGGLGGTMPGVESLAEELGVKHKTVRDGIPSRPVGQGRPLRAVRCVGCE